MSADLSITSLIINASFFVQLIMLILLSASVLSWFIIIQKFSVMKKSRQDANKFEERFWSGIELSQLYDSLRKKELHGLANIFVTGFKDFARLHKQKRLSTITISDTVQRSMRVTLSRETERLESYLSFLATVGSVSPYVGLLGTVWGIMNSFRSLAGVQQATLSAVAPGIAEALVATAIGLFAAIPAVVAYNRYVDEVDRLASRYDNFLEEFTALLQRQATTIDDNKEHD